MVYFFFIFFLSSVFLSILSFPWKMYFFCFSPTVKLGVFCHSKGLGAGSGAGSGAGCAQEVPESRCRFRSSFRRDIFSRHLFSRAYFWSLQLRNLPAVRRVLKESRGFVGFCLTCVKKCSCEVGLELLGIFLGLIFFSSCHFFLTLLFQLVGDHIHRSLVS